MKQMLVVVALILLFAKLHGATIGMNFEEHFSVELPEGLRIVYAGGKEGEKQFSFYGADGRYLTSFFAYYGGLDPREWKRKHDKRSWEFLYAKGELFVWAKLPEELDLSIRESLWRALTSIERRLQPVGIVNGEAAPRRD